MEYSRGDVVKGPDLFGAGTFRPWVLVSDTSHPFAGQEGLWVVVTTTERSQAIPLGEGDFIEGGLSKTSYANPWNVTTIKMADMKEVGGRLSESLVDQIARDAAGYLGV